MRKKKYLLLILVLFISIGFAYLSTNLYISGTSIVKRSSWSIYFNNIQNETCTYQIDSPATISSNKKEVDFTLTFEKPGDSYSFNVDIVNNGNIDAMLESYNIVGLPNEASYLEWNVVYDDGIEFNKYDLLAGNSTDTIVVTVNFKEDVDINDLPTLADTSFDLKFIVNYVQADSNAKERENGTYTITYNLDGGTISNNPTTYTKRLGATLPNPTKQGYVFAGWTGGKNLIDYNTLSESAIDAGITVDENGYMYDSTPNGDGRDWRFENSNCFATLSAGTYTLSVIFETYSYNASTYNYLNGYKPGGAQTNYLFTKYINNIPSYKNTFTYTTANQLGLFIKGYTGVYHIQLEEGDISTDWEPYNSANETIDLVLPAGTTGNRTYTANWIQDVD